MDSQDDKGKGRINLIMRSVRVTIVDVEKQEVLLILSVCLQPWLSSK